MTTDTFDDAALEQAIQQAQDAIQAWAERHDVWFDCGFKTYLDHVDGELGEEPVAFILYFSSSFQAAIYGELESEFWDIVHAHGFHYADVGYANLHFYPQEGPRCAAFADYFHWKWICRLVQPDFADVYEELYAHFARRPDDLQRLDWREYEILLARIFQTQGFVTELGPGRGDGGVDIRLLQRDPIGDVLTLVQAKKYAPKNKIGLEAVAALSGITGVERAQRSVFVTTSSYLPVARRFAARTSGALELRTSADVADWCRTARDGVIKDKSSLVTPSAVERLLWEAREQSGVRVVHAHTGYNTTRNQFALVIKEAKHAGLLMTLSSVSVQGDRHGFVGTEVPALDASALRGFGRDTVWRAKRTVDEDGRPSYWDGRNLYTPWDGRPAYFDHLD